MDLGVPHFQTQRYWSTRIMAISFQFDWWHFEVHIHLLMPRHSQIALLRPNRQTFWPRWSRTFWRTSPAIASHVHIFISKRSSQGDLRTECLGRFVPEQLSPSDHTSYMAGESSHDTPGSHFNCNNANPWSNLTCLFPLTIRLVKIMARLWFPFPAISSPLSHGNPYPAQTSTAGRVPQWWQLWLLPLLFPASGERLRLEKGLGGSYHLENPMGKPLENKNQSETDLISPEEWRGRSVVVI